MHGEIRAPGSVGITFDRAKRFLGQGQLLNPPFVRSFLSGPLLQAAARSESAASNWRIDCDKVEKHIA